MMMRDDEYFAIKGRAAAIFLRLPDVTGVGLGPRVRNGKRTREVAIKVFVKRKKPAAEVPPDELIPTSFEGVPTDVVEMQPLVPCLDPVPGVVHPENMPGDSARADPLKGGVEIAVERPDGKPGGLGGAGTLGCIVRNRNDTTAVYALTNHHILTNNRLSLSRRVLQHSPTGGGFDSTPLGFAAAGAQDSLVDAALVRLQTDQEWVPAIKEIGFVTGTFEVTLAEVVTDLYQVRKRGARTGLTGGVVEALGVESHSLRKHDMLIRPNPAAPPHEHEPAHFAFHGDSGAVVVNDDNEVVGLFWGSEDSPSPGDQFAKAVAIPIQLVLDHFEKVDHLDLEVAAATGSIPTDNSELQKVLPPAGAPSLQLNDVLARGDHHYYRPLSGGAQILAEPMLGALQSGTLGCIVRDVAAADTAYALTSFSAVSANGSIPPTTDTDVGQPDNDSSCSGCCSNTVGEFAAQDAPTSPTTTPTAAIVKLKDDQKWLSEVMEIGIVDDIAFITAEQVNSGTYQVRKRGTGTRLTGGVVTAVGGVAGVLPGGVREDSILIRPNPNPAKPGEEICFSHFVDRGAVVVNSDSKIVGVLYKEVPLPHDGITMVHGVATPIQTVFDGFRNTAGVRVIPRTTNAPDDVETTKNLVATAHDGATPPLTASAPAFDPIAELPDELSHSLPGRLAIALWIDHRAEIRHLIDHNRKVATVWHRSGGPALLQAAIRAYQAPSIKLPATINDLPIADCVARIASVFRKYGSVSLQRDIDHLHSVLPPLANRSLRDLVAGLAPA
jgi:hypothetical protein